jgi:hypothetical protein
MTGEYVEGIGREDGKVQPEIIQTIWLFPI